MWNSVSPMGYFNRMMRWMRGIITNLLRKIGFEIIRGIIMLLKFIWNMFRVYKIYNFICFRSFMIILI